MSPFFILNLGDAERLPNLPLAFVLIILYIRGYVSCDKNRG